MQNYLTKAQVHSAADVVNDQGKRPSADNVRQALGSGSNSTIMLHLKTWVPRDQRETLPSVPESLREAVESLVSDFWFIALSDAGGQFSQKLAKETADRIEAQNVAGEAGSQIDVLTAELAACHAAASLANKKMAERDREVEELKASVGALKTEVAIESARAETLKQALTEFTPNKKQKSLEFTDKQ